jgi:putative acetyltransferase
MVLDLVREAFSSEGRDGAEEVAIVGDSWSLGAAVAGLDLVAAEGTQVLGHVLGTWGRLGDQPIIGVAPLAVLPRVQHQGIGSALMHEILRRAEQTGAPFVVLLGSPAYYGRFGFEPAGPLGIDYPPVGVDNPDFMIRRFAGCEPTLRGDYTYCWELPRG